MYVPSREAYCLADKTKLVFVAVLACNAIRLLQDAGLLAS